MSKTTVAAGLAVGGLALALGLVFFGPCSPRTLSDGPIDPTRRLAFGETRSSAPAPRTAPASAGSYDDLLYGRVTTVDGDTFVGRLRFGGDQEAYWSDFLNGYKDENRWVRFVPSDRIPTERHVVEVFGFEIARYERPVEHRRPFMVRFGDVARIEARGRRVRVTLKSGTTFDLDRLDASDFDDGIRVWDRDRGVVDLDSLRIRTIEFRRTPPLDVESERLFGTVRTSRGTFTGFLRWNRRASAGADTLAGRTVEGALGLRFGDIGAIARRSPSSVTVTASDGRELVLAETSDVGSGHRGIDVDDARYGRVTISWDVFERVDFGEGDAGFAYDDFAPGGPLRGTVTTAAGRRISGRLVFDLDESERSETLDAPSGGVDYHIEFGRVASVVPGVEREEAGGGVRVLLRGGAELGLERSGDLGDDNAGMLVFVEGRTDPRYVRWSEVERVDFDL